MHFNSGMKQYTFQSQCQIFLDIIRQSIHRCLIYKEIRTLWRKDVKTFQLFIHLTGAIKSKILKSKNDLKKVNISLLLKHPFVHLKAVAYKNFKIVFYKHLDNFFNKLSERYLKAIKFWNPQSNLMNFYNHRDFIPKNIVRQTNSQNFATHTKLCSF